MKVGFGVVYAQARGKAGGIVATRARNGATLRVRITPRNPRSEAQLGIRAALTDASRAFKGLSSSDFALWVAYSEGITKNNPISGSTYHPSGITAFNELAIKFKQISPAGTIPVTPPASPFDGDTITVTAVGEAGDIKFTASAQNGTGIQTELLVQKLVSANRTPNPKGYRTQAFHHYVTGTLDDTVTLDPGIYVPAYRFVLTATGQAGPLFVLPQVTVT